jgi:chromosome partitioning protein
VALPRTIAIGTLKGGVAKTTTCLSLAAGLAELGKSVLAIDLDPQAHLTLSLGLEPRELGKTVKSALLGEADLAETIHTTAMPLLDAGPASEDLAVLERILYNEPEYEHLLKKGLDKLAPDRYDTILIDTPPSFGPLTLNALTASDLLIIPTQCEYYAGRSLHRVLELVRLVRRQTNPELVYRVLITMYDQRNRISSIIREQLERVFSDALLDTVIEVDTKLRESPVLGRPVFLYAPNTRGAEQYRDLAQELIHREW